MKLTDMLLLAATLRRCKPIDLIDLTLLDLLHVLGLPQGDWDMVDLPKTIRDLAAWPTPKVSDNVFVPLT